jgi:hypothetical protein
VDAATPRQTVTAPVPGGATANRERVIGLTRRTAERFRNNPGARLPVYPEQLREDVLAVGAEDACLLPA